MSKSRPQHVAEETKIISDQDKNDLIAVIPKNQRDEIRVSLTKFRGHQLIDVRVFVPDDEGGWYPTKKGICFKPELLPDLSEAIKKAADAVKEVNGNGRDG